MPDAVPPSEDALSAKKGSLKPGETKEGDLLKLDPTALAAMEKLYTDKNGDLKALAEATGGDLARMEKYAPKDAADFAHKMLSGKF